MSGPRSRREPSRPCSTSSSRRRGRSASSTPPVDSCRSSCAPFSISPLRASRPGWPDRAFLPDPAFQRSERFFPISSPAAAGRNAPLSPLVTSDRCRDQGRVCDDHDHQEARRCLSRCRSVDGRLRPKAGWRSACRQQTRAVRTIRPSFVDPTRNADSSTTLWIWTFILASVGFVVLAVLVFWAIGGFGELGLSGKGGVVALTLGSLFTMGLAIGLMALVFFSDRRDDETNRAAER